LSSGGKKLGFIVTILLFISVFLPLLAVILNAFLPGLFFGELNFNSLSILLEIFDRPLWSVSFKNSLILGLGAATLGVLIGATLALLRSKWKSGLGRWMDVGAWVLLIIPSFMIAQGWLLFSGTQGIARTLFGWEWVNAFVYQPMGLIFIMGLTKFPLAYLTVLTAQEWNVSHLSHAARINGASPIKAWRSVQLPLMLPSLIAGWTLVFIDTIGDFGLPAALSTVYNFPTLPYSIYTAINQSPVRFDMAGVLSFYLVLLLSLAMLILFIVMKKSRVDFLSGTATKAIRQKPKYPGLLNIVFLTSLVFCIGIPVGTSVAVSFMNSLGAGFQWDNFTLENYITVFSGGDEFHFGINSVYEGLRNSLTIAGIAAIVSMALAFTTAYVLTFTESNYKGILHVFTLISLAVPGVVLGIGYIFIWNQRWLEAIGLNLYGTPALLVIAAVAGAIPYAVRIQIGTFANISPNLLDAAAVQGANTSKRMTSIILPIVRNTLVVATLAAFGTSVFDLATAAMLQPPNFTLLPLVIDRAFEVGNYGYATASSVVGGSIVVTIILFVQMLNKLISRNRERRKRKEADKFETDS
jgi:iron(III) transport system permease protein